MTKQAIIVDSEHGGPLPGAQIETSKIPGHWLLARLGKRVLRPGGLRMTRKMLALLKLTASDQIVEFAPGLGVTARMALMAHPASYTGVEREPQAADRVRHWLKRSRTPARCQVITGSAHETDLPDASATVVYGEAMLSMQTETRKRQIIREAMRLLQPGGRYGIHELCLMPDDISPATVATISRSLTTAIHHQTVPLTGSEWESLLRAEGFEILERSTVPMALLEPGRLISDEGVSGAVRFLWRVAGDRAARARVLAMRRVFREHRKHIAAICFVVRKPSAS